MDGYSRDELLGIPNFERTAALAVAVEIVRNFGDMGVINGRMGFYVAAWMMSTPVTMGQISRDDAVAVLDAVIERNKAAMIRHREQQGAK